jgi:hypothetical protein
MSVIIRAGIPLVEGCPVLTRIKCFVTQQGVTPTLEHTFRDKLGNPVDLPGLTTESQSELRLVARWKEVIAPVNGSNPIRSAEGDIVTPHEGLVRVELPAASIPQAAIYGVDLGVLCDEQPLLVDSLLLWVEPSLFSLPTSRQRTDQGPPRVDDFRMRLQDSCRQENLLLDGLEFGDEQFAHALCRPIEYWNGQPPPLRPWRDTRNFPFREAWVSAAIGHLFNFSASNYRRNHLPYSAGGMQVDDKNKEAPYMQASIRLLDEWKQFVASTKMSHNAKLFNAWID